jgi:hypothetical protein
MILTNDFNKKIKIELFTFRIIKDYYIITITMNAMQPIEYETDSSDIEEWSGSDASSNSNREEEEEEDVCTTSNRKLIVCELYNDALHGRKKVNGHFLVYSVFGSSVLKAERTSAYLSKFNRKLAKTGGVQMRHKTIRNYEQLTKTNAFTAPQIAQCVRLPSGEMVAVLKTVYLRIFQRLWKKFYKARMDKLKRRNNIHHILLSRLTWPIRWK